MSTFNLAGAELLRCGSSTVRTRRLVAGDFSQPRHATVAGGRRHSRHVAIALAPMPLSCANRRASCLSSLVRHVVRERVLAAVWVTRAFQVCQKVCQKSVHTFLAV